VLLGLRGPGFSFGIETDFEAMEDQTLYVV